MDENETDAPRRHGAAVAAVAVAVAAALVLGVTIGALARHDRGSASDAAASEEDHDVSTTTSVTDDTSLTTTTTTVESVTSTTAPTSGSPTTTTTTQPAAGDPAQITGTATWIGHDPRAHLEVAGCPTSDTRPTCPSMVRTSVAPDGTFVLPVPADEQQWQVAAYVTNVPTCVFACYAYQHPLDAVRSVVVTADAGSEVAETLTVTARVVDVVVVDRNGEPFTVGGLMFGNTQCPNGACADGSTTMFVGTAPDGATRIVVAPDVTYELTAYAVDTGWPEPPDAWHSPDSGKAFWFSPHATMTGAALDEGHVFYVDGAPA